MLKILLFIFFLFIRLAIFAIGLRELTSKYYASTATYQVSLYKQPPIIGLYAILSKYLVYGNSSATHQATYPHQALKK